MSIFLRPCGPLSVTLDWLRTDDLASAIIGPIVNEVPNMDLADSGSVGSNSYTTRDRILGNGTGPVLLGETAVGERGRFSISLLAALELIDVKHSRGQLKRI